MLFKSNVQVLGQETEDEFDVGIGICEIVGRTAELGFGA